ncbi:MAG: MBL fold metallo-hydrolase [Armatimonadetes bacterium]|nr:MBL fold metallo-hydrolase [Armatimonadota bacterium]
MFVQQFFVKGLAHSSYLLGATTTCAIVDPRRDVEVYLEAAEDLGMKITHILETHLHADFISGHLDLAEKTGATIYAPEAGACGFGHVALSEGDAFEIEDLAVRFVETPGHTPEHGAYIVTDAARGPDPVGVFCGDTLFVGDVGRPDLFPGIAEELAANLYHSLHGKLLALPDFCEAYPAHGAGSLCGRAMGAKRTTTIGYERRYNAALQIGDESEFIASLTTNMPAAPDHFGRCSAINGAGPALVRDLPALQALEPAAFDAQAKATDAIVLDLRSYEAFGGQHIPGAWHIDFGGNFATFAGWVLPPDRDLLLVAESPTQAAEANVWLHRVGLDRARGYLKGALFAWAKAGLPLGHVAQLSSQELHAMMASEERLTLLDVRSPREFEALNIRGATNIPAPDLRARHAELDPTRPTVIVCSTGHRSSLAASLLKQHGFEHVYNAAGGMTAYSTAYLERECPVCITPHGPRFVGRAPA